MDKKWTKAELEAIDFFNNNNFQQGGAMWSDIPTAMVAYAFHKLKEERLRKEKDKQDRSGDLAM